MTVRELGSKVMALLRGRRLDVESEAELQFHIEMEVEAGLRRGLPRDEAVRLARIRAGSVTRAMEDVREQRGLGFLSGAAMDIRQAWTALRRRPGFLFVAGGALASAVTITTLVFTMIYGVLLRPLPYREPERLVRLFETSAEQPKFPLSIYNYLEDKRSNRTLDGIALYTRDDMELMHGDRPERVTAVAITDDFFPTLGATVALGRNFLPAEMFTAPRVVILSDSFWRDRWNRDPGIIGRTIRLNREEWTVVGIAPRGFQHVGGDYRSPLQGDTVAIWRPLNLKIDAGCAKGCHFTNAIARLKENVPMAAARDDLNRIMDELARRLPDNYSGKRARLEPLSREVVGKSRATLLVILATGSLVLALACINVAGLSSARVLTRRREIAVRRALGGSTWRVMRAVFSENLVLGTMAGVAGAAIAAALVPALHAIIPASFPRVHEIGFSWPAAVFAISASLITSTIAGAIAAVRPLSQDPREGLGDEGRTSSGSAGTMRTRSVLVAAEMAIACLLCCSALLLLRSSIALDQRPRGFDVNNVLTFEIDLPDSAYGKQEQRVSFFANAARALQQIPGVRAAGFSTSVPWTGYDENSGFDIEGYTPRPGESMSGRYQGADPGFFPALGVQLVQGRFLTDADLPDAPKVLVVNEALVDRYFPHGDAVGRVLDVFGAKRRIVGVTRNIQDRPADPSAEPAFWFPLAQQPFSQVRAAIRTNGDPLAMLNAVRQAMRSVDAEIALADAGTMKDIAGAALAERRFSLWLCETFAVLALALAVIGVYAMLNYAVEQRRREIGIRMALGARGSRVLWMIAGNGLTLALAGAAAGMLFAPVTGRALSALLYGISPVDPISLIAAPCLILAIAAIGCVVPGVAAVRTNPVSALRDQ